MTVIRARYLFHLASLCASPPPVTDAMSIGDLACLVIGIDAQLKANQPGG